MLQAKKLIGMKHHFKQGPFNIIDLCTGTGCVGILLSHMLQKEGNFSQVNTLLVDKQEAAISLCQENVSHYLSHHFHNEPKVRFDVIQGNIMEDTFWKSSVGQWAKAGMVDVIVSNPPYIPLKEYERLDRSVRDWEDKEALIGIGQEGWEVHKTILEQGRHLFRDWPEEACNVPRIILEIDNAGQADAVRRQMLCRGYRTSHVEADLAGKARTVCGYL
jgi:HemK-like putative methylase